MKIICENAATCKRDPKCGARVPHGLEACEPCLFVPGAICTEVGVQEPRAPKKGCPKCGCTESRSHYVGCPNIGDAVIPMSDSTPTGKTRTFESGATRDTDENKLDLEGFLSPLVLQRYAEFMNKNRKQSDGKMRDSDNWQKGIPIVAYMKSMWRHFFEVWSGHRSKSSSAIMQEALCALLFNVMGYLHELLTRDKNG